MFCKIGVLKILTKPEKNVYFPGNNHFDDYILYRSCNSEQKGTFKQNRSYKNQK